VTFALALTAILVFVALWLFAVVVWVRAVRALRRVGGGYEPHMPMRKWRSLWRDDSPEAGAARRQVLLFLGVISAGAIWGLAVMLVDSAASR
jgi:hypothetical protein